MSLDLLSEPPNLFYLLHRDIILKNRYFIFFILYKRIISLKLIQLLRCEDGQENYYNRGQRFYRKGPV
jgi:hypothetical protein